MFWFPLKGTIPKSDPRKGTHWRRLGETLTWVLAEIEADRIVLVGPGNCKGRMVLARLELERQFVRA